MVLQILRADEAFFIFLFKKLYFCKYIMYCKGAS